MKALFVGAMDSEIRFIKSQLTNIKEEQKGGFTFYLGNIGEKEIILVKSGIGRVMSGILIAVAKNYFDFDCVINIGLAGGAKGTNLGDVIIGTSYVYGDVDITSGGFGYEYGQMASCPRVFDCKIDVDKLVNNKLIRGTMCTCDSFTTSVDFVNKLQNEYFSDLDIKCYDMESAAFAQSCYFYNIPFLAIRSISDVIGSEFQNEDYKKNELLGGIELNKVILDIINNL